MNEQQKTLVLEAVQHAIDGMITDPGNGSED
jgi:hypothetical protein